MTGRSRSPTDNELVKVAYASDESEAELLQGLLRTADVNSVVRRAPGFDVPEFLSAGPREVLVDASDVPVARDVLREVDPGEPEPPSEPPSQSGRDRRTRVIAALLVAVALVTLVVCLATDVIV
jgi:hypothetical protein